ncbi:hypothetical protein D3C87_325270 [compost metagenome]
MRVLVWQDHGQIRLLSGAFSDIKDVVLDAMKFSYSRMEIDHVSLSKTEVVFENRVRNTTTDDECFEVFEFVDITEV